MPLTLRWRSSTRFPVEASALDPLALTGRSAGEVARIRIPVGNREVEAGELFEIRGEPDAEELRFEGDLTPVEGIGRGLSGGRIRVEGVAGGSLGAEMSGGSIEVLGDVGDWAGAEMRGGRLRVVGSAGDHLGAGYPGSRHGMREGVIHVSGDAGDDVGRRMRRGLIAVEGRVGSALGRDLIAGSLFVLGPIGAHAGIGMKRGTIVALGGLGTWLSAGFVSSGAFRFPFLAIYLRKLEEWGMPIPGDVFSRPFERYNGDLLENGRGEVLVPVDLGRG